MKKLPTIKLNSQQIWMIIVKNQNLSNLVLNQELLIAKLSGRSVKISSWLAVCIMHRTINSLVQ